MKPEFLESAEFYNRRYHNFSSRVIVPMSLLLVFLLGFAVFAEKEMSLSTRATVEPSRIIANIQSTSNQRIVANYLEENKLVKQGELLVQYQQGAEAIQVEAYASQLEMLKDQKKQLGYLQSSLKEGSDQFPEADKFGYQEMFRDYLSQASSLRSNVSQQNASISSQNAAASQSQAEIDNLISQTEAKIRDYKTAKSAIETGASLTSQNLAYSLYQSYKSQREENPQAKAQAVAQIEAQLSQLESSLATYRVQYAGSGAQQAHATGLDSQLESLKSQHLVKVGQELTLLDQKILDVSHRDLRRARAAGMSIIPTTTGAAEAIGKVLPQVAGKLSCHAVRVPTPDVSIIDIVLELKEKGVTAEDVNATLKKAAEGAYKGIITTNEDELVSVDYRGNEHTAIIDIPLTLTMDGGMVKIVAWYDNEWGYARRIVDMVRFLAGQKPF